jgi:hypothetical protein
MLSQGIAGIEEILIHESSPKTANPLIHRPLYSYESVTLKIQHSKLIEILGTVALDADANRNYLQSPYFFMCCALCDANLERPGQLAAGLQGDDVDTATQSALAGTLVSSLHRLKDVDNTGT